MRREYDMYMMLGLIWLCAVLLILSLYQECRKDAMMKRYREEKHAVGRKVYDTKVIDLDSYKKNYRRAG